MVKYTGRPCKAMHGNLGEYTTPSCNRLGDVADLTHAIGFGDTDGFGGSLIL